MKKTPLAARLLSLVNVSICTDRSTIYHSFPHIDRGFRTHSPSAAIIPNASMQTPEAGACQRNELCRQTPPIPKLIPARASNIPQAYIRIARGS
jgi:hypothetical protein